MIPNTGMRIGIDNISPGGSTTERGVGGMRWYLQSLTKEFSARAPQHQFVLFTPAWADPLLDNSPANVRVVRLPGVPLRRPLRVLYQQVALAIMCARENLDVFFATATVAPLFCSASVVLAVQFLQFYRWPETYGRFRTAYLKLMLPLSLRKATRAIIFTESAKQDLINWTSVAAGKVSVVPHGLSPALRRLAEFPPDAPQRQEALALTGGQPYILCVSATYGYKNHARLIQAFGKLKHRINLPHVLLLVGGQYTVAFAELRAVAEQSGVADHVVFAGRVEPFEQVVAAYRGAALTVIPTLYETFGFPALEAMACNCPVVTSNYGSMAEVAGDAAVLVDPRNVESISDGMERVLMDPALRKRLIARGRERVKEFTWERSAASTLHILEEAARG